MCKALSEALDIKCQNIVKCSLIKGDDNTQIRIMEISDLHTSEQ